ncbi:DUF6461 domain-containing protein [Streptomyces turgidiscabies]|uniref:Uncharacterized protein n=1 Tax=Streptomyces turgidiscabies (strain Car8) TaxID=698760 RepID=L7ET13_STRT8|nr:MULTISPECIES: DUF6461 domain-containing protein [Streptomyces]ELP62558.1 hypothetical protein STRTUCAR8_00988 [Streptomyces turgidiscabies Car8]MDX3494854.1 DUF6461 domain-containing protein [Streptomyces turgidiscabies]GAQ71468.1 hypothetical protein T45_03210 [Streptomyces turgidiscabies]
MTNRGVRWLVESDWHFSVTFARGITPEELAVRLGAAPGGASPSATADEAVGLLTDADIGVARIGEAEGWAFAAEYGEAPGTRHDVLRRVARGGVEAVNLDPQAFHPPPMFSYAADGELLCSFGLGEERLRWGSRPDLLQEELEAAGVVLPSGELLKVSNARHSQRIAMTLGAIERHFGMSLPRELLEDDRLPLVTVSGSPVLDSLGD